MADRISDSNVAQPKEHEGVFTEFVHSAIYAAVQEPVKGVSQLVDHIAGTNLEKTLTFMSQPTGGSGTGDWIAQQLGGAVGMILPYMLVRGGMKGLIGESAQTATTLGMSLKEAGMTGFAYQALLKPTEGNPDNNFWASRGLNGVAGAATFMTMTGSAYGLGKLSSIAESNGMARVAPLLRNPISAGVLSGLPAGVVSAEGSSLINNGKLASGSELGQSIASMALIGGAFGANEVVKAKYTDGQSIPRFVGGKIKEAWSGSAEQQRAPIESGSERPNLEISRNFAGSTSREYQLVDPNVQIADLLRTSPEKSVYAPVREVSPSGELGPQQNLLIQHLDKDVLLNQVLAQKADILATCNPLALPESFFGKHIMPSAQEGLWLTQAAGGRLRFSLTPESSQSVALGGSVTDMLLDRNIVSQFRHKHETTFEIAQAMRHFKTPVHRFIDAGADNIVMQLENGRILKITDKEWDEEWGHRTVQTEKGVVRFDHAIIGKPQPIDLLYNRAFYYLEDPAITPVSLRHVRDFNDMIERDGTYQFWDKSFTDKQKHGARQLGYSRESNGKTGLVLLDFSAVAYPEEVPMMKNRRGDGSERDDTLGDIRNGNFHKFDRL